mmetsp:Transcript_71505/g.207024  ORF Transcript_71505/g.207024 Transcript_71505/m.207024 type:complete len:228 (+) Transcript_71505:1384-2067(+)
MLRKGFFAVFASRSREALLEVLANFLTGLAREDQELGEAKAFSLLATADCVRGRLQALAGAQLLLQLVRELGDMEAEHLHERIAKQVRWQQVPLPEKVEDATKFAHIRGGEALRAAIYCQKQHKLVVQQIACAVSVHHAQRLCDHRAEGHEAKRAQEGLELRDIDAVAAILVELDEDLSNLLALEWNIPLHEANQLVEIQVIVGGHLLDERLHLLLLGDDMAQVSKQ